MQLLLKELPHATAVRAYTDRKTVIIFIVCSHTRSCDTCSANAFCKMTSPHAESTTESQVSVFFRDVWGLHNTIMNSVVTHVHVHVHFCRDPIVHASLVVKGKGNAPVRHQTYYVQMNVHVEQDQRDHAKIKYVFILRKENVCSACKYIHI